jgi:hypothetical protein
MTNGNVAPVKQRSLAGPIVLIVIGSVFLLRNLGYPIPILQWFAEYWPVLLILWGVIKLIEHMAARSAGRPAPGIGAGGYFLLFFLIMFGLAASQARRVDWEGVRGGIEIDDEFISFFGKRYEYSDTLQQEFPAGARLHVSNERGGVKVLAAEGDSIRVVVRKRIFASSEREAERLNREVTPGIVAEGGTVRVQAERNRGATVDLEIHAPHGAALEVMAVRGAVEVNGREGDVKVHASRGSVTVEEVIGSANVHLRRGNFTARNVTGDVTIEGRVTDASLRDVGGEARLLGDFFGEIDILHVGKLVSFRSSRTDMEFARLDGQIRMAGSRFVARSLEGPGRLVTRSKEIVIEEFTGDLVVENSNGGVRLQPTGAVGNIRVENRRGDIELMLPAKAAFQLDARVRQGDIRSDFPEVKVESDGREARATGTVGGGKAKVQADSDRGRIEIRRVN